jgi:acyl-[acyl-carrier-protein]-phospholipid O-acyltransferase/long-chain-fatty-acid--[acyl-carrier-protein] ligase
MTRDSVFNHLKKLAYSQPRKIIFEDVLGGKLTSFMLLMKAMFLGVIIKNAFRKTKVIGLCIPNTNAFPIVFMGLHSQGYVPAIFNYKSGATAIKSASHTVGVSVILTSRLFEAKANLTNIFNELKQFGLEFIYLEDIMKGLSIWDKISAAWKVIFTRKPISNVNDTAVILFTSGSEGVPKGVALSHNNLISNVKQVASRMDITHDDIFFSSLPFFHAFGLLAGVVFPIVYGLKSYIYHTPLDYKVIPQKIEEAKATILFSANTFLQGYAAYANPNSFRSLRKIIAGAERLTEETRLLYQKKFKVHIYEGYGVTEASPVISVNTKELNTIGSVGKPIRDMSIKIEPIEGYTEGGRLFVKGPNIMLGYYLDSSPQALVKPKDGWHDTGDIAFCDEKGYLFIRGRVKRFAKIGGEMVSLGAIEYHIMKNWPEFFHAVVSIKDPKKGEKIVLITTCKEINQNLLINNINKAGLPILHVPKLIIYQESIPLLSTGKTDYFSLENLAESLDAKMMNSSNLAF